MSKETNQEDKVKEITPEELKKRREGIIKHYKDQISVLTLQLDYEKLLADIEQARAKRMEMIIRQAQMQAGPPEEEPETDVAERDPQPVQEAAPIQEEKKERKLKVT